jgi:hypothetical protein
MCNSTTSGFPLFELIATLIWGLRTKYSLYTCLSLCKIWGFSRRWLWWMPSSGMLRRVALVRTDVSGEHNASIVRVTRISEIGTTLAVTSNRRKQVSFYLYFTGLGRIQTSGIFMNGLYSPLKCSRCPKELHNLWVLFIFSYLYMASGRTNIYTLYILRH